jgi:TPR repeat protein
MRTRSSQNRKTLAVVLIVGALGCAATQNSSESQTARSSSSSHAPPSAKADPETSLRTQCDGGDPESCYGIGVLLAAGEGVPKDPASAARYLSRACDGGLGKACYTLGQMYVMGEGVEKDPPRGLTLFNLACSLGDPRGCQVLEHIRKQMASASGDPDEAQEASVKILEGRCIGRATATDKEAQDCKRVLESLRKGCQGGNPPSCSSFKRVETAMKRR